MSTETSTLEMENLVVVVPQEPQKNGKGFQILCYERLKDLKRTYNIQLLTVNVRNKSDHINFKSQQGASVHFKVDVWDIFLNCLNTLMRGYPLQTIFHSSRNLRKYIAHLYEANPDQLFLCYMSRTLANLDYKNPPKNFVIEFVDSMYLNFKRRRKNANFFSACIFFVEAYLSKNFETRMANKAIFCTAVSKIDANLISNTVSAIPLGVNLEKVLPEGETIIFSGKMNYKPNVEAAMWFIKKVWPQIKKTIPNVKFIICGSDPHPSLIKESNIDDRIEVTGYVDDVKRYIHDSKIAVAPMVSGSGMQFKILEAMSCSRPVITTKIGLGDIKAINNKHIIISDSTNDFAGQINDLWINEKKRRYLAQNGYEFVSVHHSWKTNNAKFKNKFLNL